MSYVLSPKPLRRIHNLVGFQLWASTDPEIRAYISEPLYSGEINDIRLLSMLTASLNDPRAKMMEASDLDNVHHAGYL